MSIGGVEKCIIQLSKLLKNNNKIVVASTGGALTKELDKLNIKHYEILDTDKKDLMSVIKNIKIIKDIVKKEHIEIIHSHHRMTTLYSKIISKFLNIKVIHTQHLCIEDKFLFTKIVLNNIKVITVSNSAKEVLIKKCGLREENITTIYNTIETKCENKIVDSKLLELKNNEYFIVAQISRIIDYKGVYDFIEVAKRTTKEIEKIKFILLGDGPELNNLRELIKKEQLENDIYLLGSKDNIIEHLKYIDLVLLCSYIEGLPLVPLEAFSQGVPVIATNIDGTNEEIDDNVNGYLVEKKDINKFSRKVLELYSNKDKYNEFCNNSCVIFKERFDKNEYINKHLKIYKCLL
jgi:glycosyltransferase involved in cell wall biosynthesis